MTGNEIYDEFYFGYFIICMSSFFDEFNVGGEMTLSKLSAEFEAFLSDFISSIIVGRVFTKAFNVNEDILLDMFSVVSVYRRWCCFNEVPIACIKLYG